MIWPFGKSQSRPQPASPQKLYFKSSTDLFEYWCEYGDTTLECNRAVVALVLGANWKVGSADFRPPFRRDDGVQLANLRVASKDGGFLAIATTPSSAGQALQSDDLVLWVPSIYVEEVGRSMSDKRSGWVGMIRAKLKPELNVGNPAFDAACGYD